MKNKEANAFTRSLMAMSVAGCIFATVNVSAQSNGAAASGAVLEEVVVTARKRAESLQDVPIAIKAFDSESLERSNVDSPQDFTNLVSGVFMIDTANQGETNVSIRGVAQPRGSESSFALVMDGVLMANPNAFNQELMDIEQIEVLKGPQGALYGRNAIGGAISITTKRPNEEFEAAVEAGVGNGGLAKGGFIVSGGLADNLFGRIAVSHREFDGHYDNDFSGRDVDFYEATSIRGRLIWEATENLTFDFRATDTQVDAPANLFFTQVVGLRGGFDTNFAGDSFEFNVSPLNRQFTNHYAVKVDYDADAFTATFIIAHNDLQEDQGGDGAFTPSAFDPNYDGLFGYSAGAEDGFQYQWRNQRDTSYEIRVASNSDGRLSWMAGLYYVDIDRQTMESNGVDTGVGVIKRPYVPGITTSLLWSDNDNQAYAAFGQVEYDLTDNWELALALRWDKEKRKVTNLVPDGVGLTDFPGLVRKAEFDDLQPKVTVTYKPDENWTLFASYGEGFRSGGFNNPGSRALILTSDPDSPLQDDFDAETSEAFELGFKSKLLGGRLALNGSLFRTEQSNQHLFFFFPSPLVRVVAFLDEVEIEGAEFDFAYLANENLSFNGGISFMDTEITESEAIPGAKGKEAPHAPEYTLNLGVRYDYQLTDNVQLISSVDYRKIGEIWFDPENIPGTSRDPVDTVNAQIGIRAGNFSATLWGKNIFDEEYNAESVLVGTFLNLVAVAPPRTFGVDFKYEF